MATFPILHEATSSGVIGHELVVEERLIGRTGSVLFVNPTSQWDALAGSVEAATPAGGVSQPEWFPEAGGPAIYALV